MPLNPGNLTTTEVIAPIQGLLPGLEFYRLAGTAWIGPTPGRVWDILTHTDKPLRLELPTGPVNFVHMLRADIPAGLISTNAGEQLQIAVSISASALIQLTVGPTAGGLMPELNAANPLLSDVSSPYSTISELQFPQTLKLWLVNSTGTAAASGTLAAPTAKGVRVSVDVFLSRRQRIQPASVFPLSPRQLKQDQGF